MDEEWKDIKGYEGYYQVSNLGRVKSLDRHTNNNWGNGYHFRKSVMLKQRADNKGYLRISLSKNSKVTLYLVHRLVGNAFILNPLSKPQINHIDLDVKNNNVSNLEWVTNKENAHHSMQFGLRNSIKREDIKQLINMYNNGYNSGELATIYNVCDHTIIDTIKNNGGNMRTKSEAKSLWWKKKLAVKEID